MKAIIVATLGMLALHTASAAEVTRYVALVEGGKRAGHQWVTQDGRRTRVEFYFKDNGRGPELKESFTVDESFTFTQYQVKGESTYGSLVNETFSRDGAQARWKSTSDRGEQAVNGAALYSPLSGTPATFSVALSALARAPGGKVAMIPSGTLSQRQLLETTLTGKKSNRPLQLVALTGVGFSPSLVWATTGESPRLFAFIVPGYLQLIEEGWESHAAALEKQQKEAEQKLLVDMNQRLSHALPGTTLIRNARIFDSERALLLPASDLLLERGRIVALSATGAESRKADRVIEAAGRVLLPGLYDMHAHLSQWDGPLHLAAGVTTVRDMGNHNETLLQLIEQEKSGKLLAPRVVPAGFIEGESPMSARGSITISTLEEARRAVDWYHERGFPQIKIYNSFPKEFLPDITEYAHARGMRVSGHVPVHMRAEQVVQAGYDEIQHINQVLLNFLVTDKTDTRTLERFYLPAEKVGDLDFDSKPVQDFIALLAQRRVVIDPTLATFNFIRQSDGVMSQQFAAVADHVPPDVRRGFLQAQMKIPDAATEARYTKSYQKMIDFTGRMYRAGIPLVAGTDDIAGFTLHRELELLVEAGLTPSQSLQVATWNGALYSRTLDDRGTIQTGKRADLILVDGDPTRNIADIRKVALVIKGEVAYAPAELYEAIGVKPFAAAVAVK